MEVGNGCWVIGCSLGKKMGEFWRSEEVYWLGEGSWDFLQKEEEEESRLLSHSLSDSLNSGKGGEGEG